jgi:protein required for attachment to host cells
MKKKTWALVADGANARILKDVNIANIGEEVTLAAEVKPLGEIMADRAGRSFSSTGARRSGMELHSDPVRDNERAFASEIADRLAEHLGNGDFNELLVFAAPQTLGDLRDALPTPVKHSIVTEVDKNLTKLPRKQLWEAVRKQLAPQKP